MPQSPEKQTKPVCRGYSSATDRTTILVVCSDFRKEMTQTCLSLIKQHTANYELLVMDNANDPAFSHPASMNRAMRATDTDFMVLMDDDVYVEPGWLDGLLACIDEKTAVVVPLHQGLTHFSGVYMTDDGELLYRPQTDVSSSPWTVQRYSSALMLLDMRKIGSIRMQEKYRKFYFDVVHAFEVWEAGYRAVCTPRVSITHLYGATIKVTTDNVQAMIECDRRLFNQEWIESGRLTHLEQTVWKRDPHISEYVEIVALARQMQNIKPAELVSELGRMSEKSAERERFEKAVQYVVTMDCKAVTGKEPDAHEKLFANGRILYDLGVWQPALFCFRRALELKQEDVETWVWISLAAAKYGDWKLAATARDGAMIMEPDACLLELLKVIPVR